MRCISSICFLRSILVLLNCIFLYKLCITFIPPLPEAIESISTALPWLSVDVEDPPSLNNFVLERTRLNEFLASNNVKCDYISVGRKDDSFKICEPPKETERSCLVIKGHTKSSGAVEVGLNCTKWTVFLPLGSKIMDNLQGNVEVNYLMDLDYWTSWRIEDISKDLSGKSFDYAVIDLHSKGIQAHTVAESVKQIIQLINSKSLLLTVNLPSQNATFVTWQWYRFLSYAFYKKNNGVVAASSSGNCIAEGTYCTYRVSAAHFDDPLSVKPPPFNLGSPSEERKRMIKSLWKPKPDCYLYPSTTVPRFCEKHIRDDYTSVILSYKPLDVNDYPPHIRHSRQFRVISPENVLNLNVTLHEKIAISHDNSKGTFHGAWKLDQLENVLNRSTTDSIDLLIIDLNGDEWNIVPKLIHIIDRIHIKQISIRGVLEVEENENYSHFYWNLRCILGKRYQLTFGNWTISKFDLIFEHIDDV